MEKLSDFDESGDFEDIIVRRCDIYMCNTSGTHSSLHRLGGIVQP